MRTRKNPHEVAARGGFCLIVLDVRPNYQAYYRLCPFVKPFAYVVSSYTCQNGENKRNKNVQCKHPPSCTGIGDGNKFI